MNTDIMRGPPGQKVHPSVRLQLDNSKSGRRRPSHPVLSLQGWGCVHALPLRMMLLVSALLLLDEYSRAMQQWGLALAAPGPKDKCGSGPARDLAVQPTKTSQKLPAQTVPTAEAPTASVQGTAGERPRSNRLPQCSQQPLFFKQPQSPLRLEAGLCRAAAHILLVKRQPAGGNLLPTPAGF